MAWTGEGLFCAWDGVKPFPYLLNRCTVSVHIFTHPVLLATTNRTSVSAESRPKHRSRSPDRGYRGSHHDRSRSHSPRGRGHSPGKNRRSPSSAPEEEAVTDVFIRAVAVEVKGHGRSYEENLRRREENNPKYAFLQRDVSSVSPPECSIADYSRAGGIISIEIS